MSVEDLEAGIGQRLSEAVQREEARKRRDAEILARLGIITAKDLDAREFPEPKWAVPGYITEGLCLLGGKPKMGKSWLALGIAHAIASGGRAIGTIEVEPGPCLYIGLEDTQRRLQRRMRAITQGEPSSPNLHLATAWKRLDDGGIEDLGLWLEANPGARLVCIDTLKKVKPRAKGNTLYDDDYDSVGTLKGAIPESW